MAKTQAQIRANKKWESKSYWRPTVRLPKELENQIKSTGYTTNNFIRAAVEEKLARMNEK